MYAKYQTQHTHTKKQNKAKNKDKIIGKIYLVREAVNYQYKAKNGVQIPSYYIQEGSLS